MEPTPREPAIPDPLLAAALGLSQRGLVVIPVWDTKARTPPSHLPARPLPPAELAARFGRPRGPRGRPDGLAVVTGAPSGRDGLSLVCRNFDDPGSYAAWASAHPALAAEAPTVETPRGVHVYVLAARAPGRILRFSDGDLRAGGAYATLPPSCSSRGGYRWASGRHDPWSAPVVGLVEAGLYEDYARPLDSRLAALRALAAEYLAKGYTVVPLKHLKKAACGWKAFQASRPTADDVHGVFFTAALDAWAARDAAAEFARRGVEDPHAGTGIRGVAVVLGAASAPVGSHLVCRDFDTAGAYEAWSADRPDLAARLPTVRTGRGYHVYFRTARPCWRNLGDEGELRGQSTCYAVLPGSLHPDPARRYSFVVPLPRAEDVPLLDLAASDLWRSYRPGQAAEVFCHDLVSPAAVRGSRTSDRS